MDWLSFAAGINVGIAAMVVVIAPLLRGRRR